MLLGVRGFSYTGEFQSILSTNIKFNVASLKWTNEWVTFLESLIQLNVLSQEHGGVSTPKFIRKLTINTRLQKDVCVYGVNAYHDSIRDLTKCGGVQIDNIIFIDKSILEKESGILEIRTFVPHFHKGPLDIETALKVNLQIITENITENGINVTELVTKSSTNKLANTIIEIFENNFSDFDTEINCVEINVDETTLDIEINKKQNFGTSNLFILHNLMDNEKILKKVFNVLRNNAFVLAIEHNAYDLKPDEKKPFKIITSMFVGEYKMFLLRKDKHDVNVSYIVVEHDNTFSWLPNVRRELDSGKSVVLVSKREEFCGLIGFVKALKKYGFTNVGVIIINDYMAPKFSPQVSFYKNQIEKNLTFNVFHKGLWGGYYYLRTNKSSVVKNVILCSKNIGGIDTLTWEEMPVLPCSNNNLVQVNYSAISIHNCQKAIDTMVGENKTFGMDYSGYNTSGDRVMGLVSSGAISNTLNSDPVLVWPVPKYWSLEDAATVPLPYVHAYYCLMVQNKLEKDSSVLVLDGAEDLGQAIICICLDLNCTVFTTVNNRDKKRLLLKIFPKLKEEHIAYSGPNDVHSIVSFYAKKESLCNYVISSAKGNFREHAMKCVGTMGTFVDVSDYDKEENKEWGLSYVKRNRNYKSLNISSIFRPQNFEQKKLLHRLISDGIASGVVRPLIRVVYSPADISRAFRFMSSEQRIGRVLMDMKDTLNKQLDVTTRISFNPEGSYIVVCGENMLGVELAGWFIKRGVKKVILHQKNIAAAAYFKVRRETWKKYGVLSALSTENLQTNSGCTTLLNESEKLGPVQGIFIVQNFESDIEFDNNNIQEKLIIEYGYSVMVVSNLDKASKKICGNLSHFVVIAPSMDNHSGEFSISAIENICDARKQNQYPALLMYTNISNEMNDISEVSISESLSGFFNTLEMSLKYEYNNIVTHTYKRNISVEFMNTLSKIIGIPKIEAIEETKTLNSFKVNETCVKKIRDLLNRTFKIDYSTEELQQISIASLKKLCSNAKQNTTPVKGLRAFYNHIEKDEIFAAEPIVIMPSKVGSCTNKMPEELDSKETHLIMIPGFEGHCRIFSYIGERLKIQAAALQLSPDLEGDSIPTMAEKLLKHVKAIFAFNPKFYILGYSFGVNIALELAALLEKEGYSGVVYCLDSSPDAIKVQINAYVGKLTEFELQDYVITEIYSLISGNNDNDSLNKELKKLDNWSKKVEHCLKKLQKIVTHSHEYQKAIIDTTYKRITLAKSYEPDFKLESKLVLMKGIAHPKAETLADDYNLSKYTKQPVSVFPIESDHLSAPYDNGVSNIVNKMLEPKLLEQYKNQNLCEVYIDGAV